MGTVLESGAAAGSTSGARQFEMVPLSRAQEDPDKALAVLLTHISNSHATLVAYHEHHAETNPTPPAAGGRAGSHSAGNSTTMSEKPPNVSDVQQHTDTTATSFTSTLHDDAPSVQLLPYQQEVADSVMQEGNSVIFLPSGTSHNNIGWVSDQL